jgi:hypothetical protein
VARIERDLIWAKPQLCPTHFGRAAVLRSPLFRAARQHRPPEFNKENMKSGKISFLFLFSVPLRLCGKLPLVMHQIICHAFN